MKEMIDLYSKLVIGTFSFIGPSFTLLIPLFFKAFEKSRIKHDAVEKNLQLVIAENIRSSSNLSEEMKKNTKTFRQLQQKNKSELNLLKPKRQVRRLFISLLIAILLIAFYYFQKSNFWKFDNWVIRGSTLLGSLLSFLYCIRVLWQVFCTIIRIKSEEEAASVKKSALGSTFMLKRKN